MQTSETINELATALAKAQGQFNPASKDAENEAFKRGGKASKYADISAVWEAIRKPLSDNGLSVIQQPVRAPDGLAITTRILHASGQWIEFDALTVPFAKPDAHGVGSATTYARRFALCAALGIVADDDDDGNAAAGKQAVSAPELNAPAAPGTRKLSKPQARPEYDALVKELQAIQNPHDLAEWGKMNKPRMDAMPDDWQQSLRNEYIDHKRALSERAS